MLARLQWTAFGLRSRIVGAVLVTTVVTLGVAALVLLSRLEQVLTEAARGTLATSVQSAIADHEIAQIEQVRYQRLAALRVPQLDGTADRAAALTAGRQLSDRLQTLKERLGATDVLLVGYIDASGHGVTIPVGPDRDSTVALGGDALSDIRRAVLGTKHPVYALSSGEETVRATIPLRGADAALVVRKSINEVPKAVAAVGRAFEIAAIAGLVLTALLAIPLAGTIVRRLRRLRLAALRVAAEGTGAEFPIDRARDEVGDLGRSFAIMNRRLRHQEEARRAFVATASHELRTPLTSLDGMLELLADDLRAPDLDLADAIELLERARAQSRRLGRLAADLLDLTRIDADVALRSEPVELAELTRAVVAEFELAMSARGVRANLDRAQGPLWAQGDPGSIARIIRILLDNGLRFAPRGTELTVELSPGPTVQVSDAGPGVAPEERELIFERFKRGRQTGGEAGFGLGLAIGRELAQRMGGSLELLDVGGSGASFRLQLPAAVDAGVGGGWAASGRQA